VALDHAQANMLAEASTARLSRNDFDSALRLASRGTRIDLALPADKTRASPAAAALAAVVSQANWRLALGGHGFWSAAFSPDGPRAPGTQGAPRRPRSCAAMSAACVAPPSAPTGRALSRRRMTRPPAPGTLPVRRKSRSCAAMTAL